MLVMIEQLFDAYRLLILVGAGGVGKTTSAAKLALKAATLGKRVAVLTIDPARRLADVLGLPVWRGEYQLTAEDWARMGVEPQGSLTAMMFDPREEADAVVTQVSPDLEQANALLNNRFYQVFSTSLAGSQEFLAVLGVAHLCADERFDLVLLDTAPASRAMEFFDTPNRVFQALENPWLKSFLTTHQGQAESLSARLSGCGKTLVLRALEAMTGAGFLEDLTHFLALFSNVMHRAHSSCVALHKLFRAPETGFLAVTSTESAPLEDALQLRRDLMERHMQFAGFICHQAFESIELPSLMTLKSELADFKVENSELLAQKLLDLGEMHNRLACRDHASMMRLSRSEAPWFVLDK